MENVFGKNLKRLRQAKGLTMKELASKLDIKFQSVGKWEDGTTMPTGKRVTLIAEILGVSESDLYLKSTVAEPPTKYESRINLDGMVVMSQAEYNALISAKNRELQMMKENNDLLRENNQLRSELMKQQKKEIEELAHTVK